MCRSERPGVNAQKWTDSQQADAVSGSYCDKWTSYRGTSEFEEPEVYEQQSGRFYVARASTSEQDVSGRARSHRDVLKWTFTNRRARSGRDVQ
jgi:hypothetical protein